MGPHTLCKGGKELRLGHLAARFRLSPARALRGDPGAAPRIDQGRFADVELSGLTAGVTMDQSRFCALGRNWNFAGKSADIRRIDRSNA